MLARGGFASVYRGVQDWLDREVAVKVENVILDNERDRRRFLRQARAAAKVSSHAYVVELYGAGVTEDQRPYMIMELCDGSYADRLKAGPLTASETRSVGVKIADALAAAHRVGVLHRDVKPANLLISRWGEPRLADFGQAVLTNSRDSYTMEVVTPAYSPPESLRPGPPTPAVDVYSLCATLYAMLSGRPPRWQPHHHPSIATLVDMFNQPIADLPGVPRAMMDLLRAGMANDPKDRPTAEDLRDELASLPLGRSAGTVVRASAPIPAPRPRRSSAVAAVPPAVRPAPGGPVVPGRG